MGEQLGKWPVCQRAFSLLAIWCLGPRVQILHSAEENNKSPFDLNIACLCQSIEINNNKYVYRQSQVPKSTDSGVKWAECSLIIGTGCRVQVFSLILDSSVRTYMHVCMYAYGLTLNTGKSISIYPAPQIYPQKMVEIQVHFLADAGQDKLTLINSRQSGAVQ